MTDPLPTSAALAPWIVAGCVTAAAAFAGWALELGFSPLILSAIFAVVLLSVAGGVAVRQQDRAAALTAARYRAEVEREAAELELAKWIYVPEPEAAVPEPEAAVPEPGCPACGCAYAISSDKGPVCSFCGDTVAAQPPRPEDALEQRRRLR